jgi:hypothetical protein
MAHDADEQARESSALIDAYRRRAEPPPGAADRGWHALQRRIAAGDQDPLGDAPLAEPRARWRPWVIGLAAAAAVLLAVGLSSRTAERGGLGGAVQALFERIWGPSQQTTPTPGPAPQRAVQAAPITPVQPVPSDMPPATGPEGQPAAGLARELEQVRAADAAIRAGDGDAALAAADAYLRAHPTGTFAPEARFHRIAALCLLGHKDAAREAAAAFERDYPSSPLRARVAALCAP